MEKKTLKLMVNSYLVPGWVIAGVLSYAINHSFWWCVFHMMCSWLYVVYWACQHSWIPNWIMKYVGI